MTKCWLKFFHHQEVSLGFKIPCRISFHDIFLRKYLISNIALILPYFGKNCFSPKTWIFQFPSTLVNTCWPHVYPPRKLILESSKGRLELHFLSISWSQTSYSLRESEHWFFVSLPKTFGKKRGGNSQLPAPSQFFFMHKKSKSTVKWLHNIFEFSYIE